MLIRIVSMHFREEGRETFLSIFRASSPAIRAFKGCRHLELLSEPADPCSFTTYSFWENENALEAYRNSELFRSTWAQTKVLFDRKPEARTLERLITVEGGDSIYTV